MSNRDNPEALSPITEEEVLALGERGYFIRDGFLGEAPARAAREALEGISFRAAGVGRGSGRTLDARVRSDEIAWLDEDAPPPLAAIRARFEILRTLLHSAARISLRRIEVQVARYVAGAFYERHTDAFRGNLAFHTGRVLTAIVYLNPDWREENGGWLRLHVHPPVDVAPRLDRLVVFQSARVEHEVLPCHAPRYAATAWYHAAD